MEVGWTRAQLQNQVYRDGGKILSQAIQFMKSNYIVLVWWCQILQSQLKQVKEELRQEINLATESTFLPSKH